MCVNMNTCTSIYTVTCILPVSYSGMVEVHDTIAMLIIRDRDIGNS